VAENPHHQSPALKGGSSRFVAGKDRFSPQSLQLFSGSCRPSAAAAYLFRLVPILPLPSKLCPTGLRWADKPPKGLVAKIIHTKPMTKTQEHYSIHIRSKILNTCLNFDSARRYRAVARSTNYEALTLHLHSRAMGPCGRADVGRVHLEKLPLVRPHDALFLTSWLPLVIPLLSMPSYAFLNP
ncbi:hypothetical protein PIB30_070867, partial [Stylosanthes scabra]|nr:hypothetical protein [Stylosanthes scabra]